MTDTTRTHIPAELSTIFVLLDSQDVEQFYASYQLWLLQQQMAGVQAQIQNISQQLTQNQEQLQHVQPSAIALSTLACLQAHDVNDNDLLDRLLERGEAWLDRIMQRLAYCEKFDFIRGNYTEWCEHALEGAYDWIDSVAEASTEGSDSLSPHELPVISTPVDVDATNVPQVQTTEEMLLQKLMSDEDEALMSTPTLKIASITPTPPFPLEEIQEASEISAKTTDTSDTTDTIDTSDTMDPTNISATHAAIPTTSTDTQDEPYKATPPVQEASPDISPEATNEHEEENAQDNSWHWNSLTARSASNNQALQSAKPQRKRSFWQRLLLAIFGGK